MITLENPPKSGIIYKTVVYLNGKLTDQGEPSTGCALFWQSVLWFLFLLNMLVVPVVLVETVYCLGLDVFIGDKPFPITAEYFLTTPCVIGAFVGLISGIIISTLLGITFSWLGVILLLGYAFYVVNKHFVNKPFKFILSKLITLFKMGKPFWKWLSKFKIKCEEY